MSRLLSIKTRFILFLILLNTIPTYESMFNSYRPVFTNPGRYDLSQWYENYAVYTTGFYFGLNMHPWDADFKERWHRIRIGFPCSPITLDFEEHKKQFRGIVEVDVLAIKLILSAIIVFIIEVTLFGIVKLVEKFLTNRLKGSGRGRRFLEIMSKVDLIGFRQRI